jgi:aminopeptidase N
MWEFSLYTYNVIAYAKGALYIDALRKTAGDEAFLAALRDYYTANRYQTVDGTALRDAVAQRCNCDVQSVYARWVSP